MRPAFILCVLALPLLLSCSGTKHLPPGEALYIGTGEMKLEKVKYDKPWEMKRGSQKIATVYWALWDLPNGSVGFPQFRSLPTRLIMYNWFYTDKQKGFSHWMQNNFGEPPITVSSIQPALKVKKVVNIFENFGHFGTTGSYNIQYNARRNKAKIYYRFLIPQAYTYRNIDYVLDSSQVAIDSTFQRYKPSALIQPGDEFSLDKVREEKAALWTYLQNAGHYYLREGDVDMLADTTVGKKQIDVQFTLADGLPGNYYQPQIIRDRVLIIDSLTQSDSSRYYRWDVGKIKRKLFDSLVRISPGDRYSLTTARQSVRDLSELGIFNNPTIAFHVAKDDSLHLHSRVTMEAADATRMGVNVKGNYRTTGYLGPSLGVNLTQLNLFGGAENLSIDLDGYYYFPTGVFQDRISRSSGFSLRSSVSAPLMRTPFNFVKRNHALPKRVIAFNAEFNDRKDYFTLATWSASYSIAWKSSPKLSHKLTLVEATYSNVINSTPRFDTLLVTNPSLKNTLVNQFIFGSSYGIKYDNSSTENKRIGTYFEGKIELAGNTLALLSTVVNHQDEGRQKVLGEPFSQFAQFSYDFRAYMRVGRKSKLAFRHTGGVGVPFGNSNQMPFIKQYFIGGSNSLRPINARNVGPGRYIELKTDEVNQVGDLKLEWNLEYRFPIGFRVDGALWSDAGNIWLLKEDPTRPFSQVRWNHIFADSYLTFGAGLRVNVNFLVMRLDYGAVLYSPIFIEGYKWIWQNKLPLYGPVIGVGMPF